MIGIIDFVVSINKIALIAFFTVLAFLIFEIKKMAEEKKKKEKPVVPQFIGDITIQSSPVANSTPLPPPLIINYKKSDQNLQDSITDINVMDRDGINDDSNYDNIKSYDNYEADVDKAIEMLKRGKSVREIADSTVLLKEDIRKLKRKLRND